MAYGIPHSNLNFPYNPRQQELELEKELLQRRIREINFELDDLREQPLELKDRDWIDESCDPIECTKFEQFMQSVIVVGLTVGAAILILL